MERAMEIHGVPWSSMDSPNSVPHPKLVVVRRYAMLCLRTSIWYQFSMFRLVGVPVGTGEGVALW